MVPRKMVQINPFAGQEWRHRRRELTWGHRWGRGAQDELGE